MGRLSGKLIAEVVVVAAVWGAVGSLPAWGIGGRAGLATLGAALGVCVGPALLSAVVLRAGAGRGGCYLGTLWLAGAGLRLMLTMVGAGVAYSMMRPGRGQFVLWLTLSYLVLLGWETWQVLRAVGVQDGRGE